MRKLSQYFIYLFIFLLLLQNSPLLPPLPSPSLPACPSTLSTLQTPQRCILACFIYLFIYFALNWAAEAVEARALESKSSRAGPDWRAKIVATQNKSCWQFCGGNNQSCLRLMMAFDRLRSWPRISGLVFLTSTRDGFPFDVLLSVLVSRKLSDFYARRARCFSFLLFFVCINC